MLDAGPKPQAAMDAHEKGPLCVTERSWGRWGDGAVRKGCPAHGSRAHRAEPQGTTSRPPQRTGGRARRVDGAGL